MNHRWFVLSLGALLSFACGAESTPSDRFETTTANGSPGSGGNAGETGANGVGTGGTGANGSPSSSGPGGPDSGLRYHEVRAKSAHNAYERDEAIFDQLAYHRTRSLEFDIHTGKLTWPELGGNWYVYHDTFSPQTTCHRLSDCLSELRAFRDAVPAHEVISLILDLKTAFKSGHTPSDLDALVSSSLPNGALFRPQDAIAACPGASSLRDAVATSCLWPTLASLRGKVIVLITGGDSCDANSYVSQYAKDATEAMQRVGFVAPNVHIACDWPSYANDRHHVAFFNMAALDAGKALDVQQAGLVARVWGLNSAISWGAAFNSRAQLLGTDKVNHHKDPWTSTHQPKGWPFDCLSKCDSPTSENDQLLAVDVASGDLWDKKDSFYFLHRDLSKSSTLAAAWSSYLTTPNSHVEPWAKGCLMARRSLDDDAAYIAVCRPADQHKIRVQVRAKDGESTKTYEIDINPDDTIDDPSAAFIRLEAESGAKTFHGRVSQDGKNWKLIHERTFEQPLYLQGPAASSHDAEQLRFYFGALHHTVAGQPPSPQLKSDFTATAIGAQASGAAHDGY